MINGWAMLCLPVRCPRSASVAGFSFSFGEDNLLHRELPSRNIREGYELCYTTAALKVIANARKPYTALPDLPQFLASSSRWLLQIVLIVRFIMSEPCLLDPRLDINVLFASLALALIIVVGDTT